MSFNLNSVKFIDLKKSVLNDEESDPKRNRYVFKKKVLYEPKDPKNKWWLTWFCEKNELQMVDAQTRLKYDFLSIKDDIWAEGAVLGPDGHYRHGDMVLMKCKIIDFVERKLEARDEAERRSVAIRGRMDELAEQMGGKLTDEEKERLFGEAGLY